MSLNNLARKRLKQLIRKSTICQTAKSESHSLQLPNQEIHITKHAYNRARQRLRWKKTSLTRMFRKSLDQGLCQTHFSGDFGRYLREKLQEGSRANRLLIYGEVLFLLHNNTLITLYQLPTKYHGYLKEDILKAA